MASRSQDADSKKLARVSRALNKREVAYADGEPDPDAPTADRLEAEWKRLVEHETELRAREREVAKREKATTKTETELEERQTELGNANEKLEHERRRLDEDREEHARADASLMERERELDARDREIERREVDAERGFREMEREVLRDLRETKEKLRSEIAELDRQVAEHGDAQRSAAREGARRIVEDARGEADQARELARQQMQALRDADEDRRLELERREQEVAAGALHLKEREELVEVEREMVQLGRAELIAMTERRVRAELDEVSATLESVSSDRDRLRGRLLEVEQLINRSGGDPLALAQHVDALEAERDHLLRDLRLRPDVARLEELEAKAAEADDLREEVSLLQRAASEHDAQLRRQGIAVAELEVMRDERDSLETQKRILQEAIREYRAQMDELEEMDNRRLPFPRCSEIDEDAALQRPTPTAPCPPLPEFIEQVRGTMASEERYYTALDTQLFVAGLAATRLHLLQGHSGTGKTTLPVQFARAIGAEHTVIEVQAGWRDQDDLFGYYNAFERRFYESEFTTALYRAQMPANRDRMVLVVLDEMNLAHPEQYFSTVLSKLENPADDPRIELVPRRVEGAPRGFVGERAIPWPTNVWFVGTANQDETTVAFADKTVDRSHLQELPLTFQEFRASSFTGGEPISLTSLHDRMGEAVASHEARARQVIEVFRDRLAPMLNRLGASWSNRVDKQLGVFVPVAVAGGASVSDAADHVLATKILRKVVNRHDLHEEHLERLLDVIRRGWSPLGSDEPPRSVEMLEREVARLAGSIDLDDVS